MTARSPSGWRSSRTPTGLRSCRRTPGRDAGHRRTAAPIATTAAHRGEAFRRQPGLIDTPQGRGADRQTNFRRGTVGWRLVGRSEDPGDSPPPDGVAVAARADPAARPPASRRCLATPWAALAEGGGHRDGGRGMDGGRAQCGAPGWRRGRASVQRTPQHGIGGVRRRLTRRTRTRAARPGVAELCPNERRSVMLPRPTTP